VFLTDNDSLVYTVVDFFLSVFDTEVQSKERSVAKKVYDQKNEMVRETIAFLRRSQGPPDLYYRRNHNLKLTTAVSPTQLFQMQRS